jgi:hypothetical protein
MKKIASILFLAALFAANVNAQSTTPRWGSGPPTNDNTGRVLTYAVQTVPTLSTTTVKYQVINAYSTVIHVGPLTHALTDSVSIINSYDGDMLTFVFTADTLNAGRVVTFGNHLYSAGTLTVPNSKSSHSGSATITFIYDGQKSRYTEIARTINTN